jgi:hypothetical protein
MTAPAWAAVTLEQEGTVAMGGEVGVVGMGGVPLGGGVPVAGSISPRRKREGHRGPCSRKSGSSCENDTAPVPRHTIVLHAKDTRA